VDVCVDAAATTVVVDGTTTAVAAAPTIADVTAGVVAYATIVVIKHIFVAATAAFDAAIVSGWGCVHAEAPWDQMITKARNF
jgi:hypothetical protein